MLSRTTALLGEKSMTLLQSKRVILFGIGGVGSWCAEALIRTGLTHLTIVDGDTVQASNLNRQLPATQASLGMPKVEALKARLLEINPDAEIEAIHAYYGEKGMSKDGSFNFQLSTTSSTLSMMYRPRPTLYYTRRACAGSRSSAPWAPRCVWTLHRSLPVN